MNNADRLEVDYKIQRILDESLPDRARSCGDCRFWCEDDSGDLGVCRRHAPRVGDKQYIADWPKTIRTDWCGEGELKPAPISEDDWNNPLL